MNRGRQVMEYFLAVELPGEIRGVLNVSLHPRMKVFIRGDVIGLGGIAAVVSQDKGLCQVDRVSRPGDKVVHVN